MRCHPGTIKHVPNSQTACEILGWQPNLLTAECGFLFLRLQTVVLLEGGVEDFSVAPPTCLYNKGI